MDSILTKKVVYVVKALYFLGVVRENENTSVMEIAAEIGAPKRFLEQLFLRLRKAGLLESVRGAAGGYCLTRPLEEISYYDILAILDAEAEAERPAESGGMFGEDRFVAQLRGSVESANRAIMLGDLVDDVMRRQAQMRKVGGYVYNI